jgi:hypothetical protein
MNNAIERMLNILNQDVDKKIRKAGSEAKSVALANSAFLPLVISSAAYEVPTGKQVIFDVLEVSASTTLTINGRMCVRDGLENGGVIENNGVLRVG